MKGIFSSVWERTSFLIRKRQELHLDSIRNMILDPSAKLSFNNAVKEFSEDELSKSNNGLLIKQPDQETLILK
jgi:hypothetical protein